MQVGKQANSSNAVHSTTLRQRIGTDKGLFVIQQSPVGRFRTGCQHGKKGQEEKEAYLFHSRHFLLVFCRHLQHLLVFLGSGQHFHRFFQIIVIFQLLDDTSPLVVVAFDDFHGYHALYIL